MRHAVVGGRTPRLFSALLAAALFAALPAGATVIDSFQSTSTWGSFSHTEGGSTIAVTPVAGQVDGALKLTYALGNGSYAGIDKVTSRGDIPSGNLLSFYYKATDVTSRVELKFAADDAPTGYSASLIHKLTPVSDGTWRQAQVFLSTFTTLDSNNGLFQMSAARGFSFGPIREGGGDAGGVLELDRFELVKASVTIDGFETPGLNAQPNPINSGSSGGTASGGLIYVTTQVVSGSWGGELKYAVGVSTDYVSFSEDIGYPSAVTGLGVAFSTDTDRLEFWAKADAAGRPLNIEMWYRVGTSTSIATRSISSYTGSGGGSAGLTTTFQRFSIPLKDFSGANLNNVFRFAFVVTGTTGSGFIYFDDIGVVPDDLGRTYPLEEFSADKVDLGYDTNKSDTAALQFSVVTDASVPGAVAGNRVGRLSYTFSANGAYAVLERRLSPNLQAEPAIRFRLRGGVEADKTSNDNLEVKLEDSDGSIYVHTLARVTNTSGAWRTVTIPVAEFGLVTAGGNASLNLRRISKVVFAVTRAQGGTGTLVLDELEAVDVPALEKSGLGSVIDRVSTPDNPFSPNNDGAKDAARFFFTLLQQARMTLKVYGLNGAPVRVIDGGDRAAGQHVIEWDGADDDGRLVSNGIYLFFLEADASAVGAGTESFKQVIGVIR